MDRITQHYTLQNRDTYSLLRFSGDIDAAVVDVARPAILAQLPVSCRNIIIDLSDVAFLDSHGVGLFAHLLKLCHRQQGRFFIAGVEGQPASVLRMVGFNDSLATYCQNVQQALFTLKP